MVELTPNERLWLKNNFPELHYDLGKHRLFGKVNFSLRYNEIPVIKGSYCVEVDFSSMKDRSELPSVYNTDRQIINAAKRKRKPLADFHIDSDGKLCMIFPCKLPQFYANGFNIQEFMIHLCNHLYWVSCYDLYDKEPWPGEKHGDEALIEYITDYSNIDLIVKDKKQLEFFRSLFNKKYGKGIAINKLKNRLLADKSLFMELTNSK